MLSGQRGPGGSVQFKQLIPALPALTYGTGGWNPKLGDIYLFIYQVRPQAADSADWSDTITASFCTVLVAASNRDVAEKIGINAVHQRGLHILRTDTATRLSLEQMLGDADSRSQLEELRRFGTAVRLGPH